MPITNPEKFVEEYWQKKPCVIRDFIPDFSDPIDEHELAGLAQLDEIDARILSQHEGKWTVTQGPIEDFSELCMHDWTLLVQGVDRYIEEVDALFEHVTFLPAWRTDDVMVSYSVKNAGVGAHIDEYDVFIVQGKGRRRWQVGLPGEFKTHVPHPLLRLIDGFSPIIDVELDPGDAIYIPPHHPHCGVTIEDSLNYSLGFRAPNTIELLFGFVDECMANRDEDTAIQNHLFADLPKLMKKRYTDADLSQKRKALLSNQHLVSNAELLALKKQLINFIEDESTNASLLQFISRQDLHHDEPIQNDSVDTKQDLLNLLSTGVTIAKSSGVKPIYTDCSELDTEFVFYVDGQHFSVEKSLRTLFKNLIKQTALVLSANDLQLLQEHEQGLLTLLELINAGYYFIKD
ncbi:cupin domain-containing protein [Agaribacter flavus]|uniref:Cupin domain-containing protein n=1 Tax=Agaribacter flavus TaxID=1902781 RepID=A0ABV7FNE5_9ALTE